MKDNKILLHYLIQWFGEFSKQDKVWSKNSIGRYLKQQLTQLNHWKNKPRGKSFVCKSTKRVPLTLQTDDVSDIVDYL